MPHHILAAIRSQPWAILPGYLEAIEAIAQRVLSAPAVQAVADDGHTERHLEALAVMGERVQGTRGAAVRDGVGSLAIMGPIFPRAAMLNPSGAGATALDHAAADLRTLQADKSVKRIMLVVDSPGGVVTDVEQFGRLVASSEKPIAAHVTGMGCSAAYWIASQASAGLSLDPTGVVGSIGVAMSTSVQEGPDVRGRRDLDITSSNAPNKRPDLNTEEGRASVREMLDAIEGVFIAAVAKGRGVSEATVKRDFGAGGTKTGKQAKEAGMVDRVEADGLEGAIRRLAKSAPASSGRSARAASLELAQLRAGL
jgi:ClpP class serine protease